jgi:hypothetical protein
MLPEADVDNLKQSFRAETSETLAALDRIRAMADGDGEQSADPIACAEILTRVRLLVRKKSDRAAAAGAGRRSAARETGQGAEMFEAPAAVAGKWIDACGGGSE